MNSNSERAVWFLGNPPKKPRAKAGLSGSDSLGGTRSVRRRWGVMCAGPNGLQRERMEKKARKGTLRAAA
jgi:hypothetical protein